MQGSEVDRQWQVFFRTDSFYHFKMELDKPKDDCAKSPSKLSNGYVLPQGKLTPNALFVGGIDLKVDENEIRDIFSKFGTITEVKIISYRGGICKGYGFVYFNEEVEIQTIIEQQVSFKGKKLKLGPAIMKERNSRTYSSAMPNLPNGPNHWENANPNHWENANPNHWEHPNPYVIFAYYPHVGGAVPQAQPGTGGGHPYPQPYAYPRAPGGIMYPQMPPTYAQNGYSFQYSGPGPAPIPAWVGGDQHGQPMNLVNAPVPAWVGGDQHGQPMNPVNAPVPAWVGGEQHGQPMNPASVDCGVQTLLTVL
ncbi:deleted in azoospermia-like isoform X2 [Gadus morhua]|uniref:deleted in azoospermia-like isoform X2 n=1 Tax=Gadus morhua TaxID=8049 RepID=UPI0011B7F2A2|nr:deleted in azoospermia-like isoform X2 [Gadus morhua]